MGKGSTPYILLFLRIQVNQFYPKNTNLIPILFGIGDLESQSSQPLLEVVLLLDVSLSFILTEGAVHLIDFPKFDSIIIIIDFTRRV